MANANRFETFSIHQSFIFFIFAIAINQVYLSLIRASVKIVSIEDFFIVISNFQAHDLHNILGTVVHNPWYPRGTLWTWFLLFVMESQVHRYTMRVKAATPSLNPGVIDARG